MFNLCTFSVSEVSINLYFLTTAIRAILASMRASLMPMHDLGPSPNGMWAIWCLFSFSSLVNLKLKKEKKISIKIWVSAMLKPFRIKNRWFGPKIWGVLYMYYRNNNCAIFGKKLAINLNIIQTTTSCTIVKELRTIIYNAREHTTKTNTGTAGYILSDSCMTISTYERLWAASNRDASCHNYTLWNINARGQYTGCYFELQVCQSRIDWSLGTVCLVFLDSELIDMRHSLKYYLLSRNLHNEE